jgi:hypothetical protein
LLRFKKSIANLLTAFGVCSYTEVVKKLTKTYYYSLFLVFFLLVSVLVGYFLETQKREEPVVQVPEEIEDVREVARELVYRQGNPIKKGIVEDGQAVEYQLIGSFTEALTFNSQEPKAPIQGRFVLKDDPFERAIPVYVGSGIGRIYFGEFQGSFEASSTWRWISMEEFATQRYREGERVLIRIRSAPTIERIRELEAVLDVLAREFDAGNYQLAVPDDFHLLTESVGVVR